MRNMIISLAAASADLKSKSILTRPSLKRDPKASCAFTRKRKPGGTWAAYPAKVEAGMGA